MGSETMRETRANLFAIMQSLKELHDNGEAIIFNDDLKSIRVVLDNVGYIYFESPTNHLYTEVKLKYH
jgi:hypothetical protein